MDMEPGPFEYKYIWQHSHGEAEWESTANRSYLGTDGPFCKDGEFNHNECVQKPGSYVSRLQVQAIVLLYIYIYSYIYIYFFFIYLLIWIGFWFRRPFPRLTLGPCMSLPVLP